MDEFARAIEKIGIMIPTKQVSKYFLTHIKLYVCRISKHFLDYMMLMVQVISVIVNSAPTSSDTTLEVPLPLPKVTLVKPFATSLRKSWSPEEPVELLDSQDSSKLWMITILFLSIDMSSLKVWLILPSASLKVRFSSSSALLMLTTTVSSSMMNS